MAAIQTVKIHPAIGVARLGNSPTKFFIGPELPGRQKPPVGGYKDAQGRVKRQAARFRLFGYDGQIGSSGRERRPSLTGKRRRRRSRYRGLRIMIRPSVSG